MNTCSGWRPDAIRLECIPSLRTSSDAFLTAPRLEDVTGHKIALSPIGPIRALKSSRDMC